jgi:hypothetical protein
MRGTSNKNQMPSAHRRRRLRQHCLDRDGDGTTVACAFGCGLMLVMDTITLDRFPVSGYDGGTYRRENVRAACGPCNSQDGSNRMHIRYGHTLREKAS